MVRTADTSERGIAIRVIAAARRFIRKTITTMITRIAAVAQRVLEVGDSAFDEIGLPEDVPVDGHARWQRALDVVQRGVERARQFQCVRAGLLLNSENHGRLCRYANPRRVSGQRPTRTSATSRTSTGLVPTVVIATLPISASVLTRPTP